MRYMLVACVLCMWLLYPRTAAQKPDAVGVAIGDSIVSGYPLTHSEIDVPTMPMTDPAHHIAGLLVRSTGYQWRNMGIGGQTTGDIAPRVRSAVAVLHPTAVVLDGGTNDLHLGKSEQDFERHWQAMLDSTYPTRTVVLLIGPIEAKYAADRDRWNNDLRRIARRHPHAIPVDTLAILSGPGTMADAVHPNAQGYTALAAVIARAL